MHDTALHAPDLEEAHSCSSDWTPPTPPASEAEDAAEASTLPSASVVTVRLDAASTARSAKAARGVDAKRAHAEDAQFFQHAPPCPLALREARARAADAAAEDAYARGDVDVFTRWYSDDAHWRDRTVVVRGRDAIGACMRREMNEQFDRVQRNVVFSVSDDRAVVQFERDYADAAGRKFHAHGVECWEFDEEGRLRRREASVNEALVGSEEGRPADDRAESTAFC